MKLIQNNSLSETTASKQIGLRSFQVGIFLLPSAPSLSVFFLLASIAISISKRKESYFEDRWNYPFLIAGILMLLSCSIAFFNTSSSPSSDIFQSSWIDLANWLPFFLCFWSIQPYLISKEHRKACALAFVCGSIPVIITGFGQYWFNWHGPFDLFNGLIIWYQRPINTGGGLTGLFNNANYAGALLTMILPFSLMASSKPRSQIVKRIIVLVICIAIVVAIILTNSRSSWLCLIITLPLIFGARKVLISMISIILTIFISSNIFSSFNNLVKIITPSRMLANFDFNSILSDARVIIWKDAAKYIYEKPIFGFGGSGFAMVEEINAKCSGASCYQHAHNIPLEIAIKYGIPTALILSISVIILLSIGYKEIIWNHISSKSHTKNDSYDKAWVVSGLIIFISHLFDVQYFDIRISFFSWVLLAGIRNIIYQKNNN